MSRSEMIESIKKQLLSLAQSDRLNHLSFEGKWGLPINALSFLLYKHADEKTGLNNSRESLKDWEDLMIFALEKHANPWLPSSLTSGSLFCSLIKTESIKVVEACLSEEQILQLKKRESQQINKILNEAFDLLMRIKNVEGLSYFLDTVMKYGLWPVEKKEEKQKIQIDKGLIRQIGYGIDFSNCIQVCPVISDKFWVNEKAFKAIAGNLIRQGDTRALLHWFKVDVEDGIGVMSDDRKKEALNKIEHCLVECIEEKMTFALEPYKQGLGYLNWWTEQMGLTISGERVNDLLQNIKVDELKTNPQVLDYQKKLMSIKEEKQLRANIWDNNEGDEKRKKGFGL